MMNINNCRRNDSCKLFLKSTTLNFVRLFILSSIAMSQLAWSNADTPLGVPDDANQFLSFLNLSAPRNNESISAGEAYYNAVDPTRVKRTLAGFKTFNGLSDNQVAIYINDADLGFGRRMYVVENTDGSVASCVDNYGGLPTSDPQAGSTNAQINTSESARLSNAKAHGLNGLIATVCMEYSGTPGTGVQENGFVRLKGRKFVKFLSYGANGNYITQADLDGRGAKTQPGLCNSCHGGQGKSLVNGVYPDLGDTGAQFLPWDLDTYKYDTAAGFTRSDQEVLFKRYNQTVLSTYPTPDTASFNGNVLVPAGQTVTIPITVNNVKDIVTSVFISIDADQTGAAGITHSTDIQFIKLSLISPTGYQSNISLFQFGLQIGMLGLQDLYIGDTGRYKQEFFDGYSNPPANKIVNGTIQTSVRIVADPSCQQISGNSCSNANGIWKLEVQNNSQTNSANVKAFSLHFNGIPDGAYTPAAVELIRGWYGGKNLPNATFNGGFVPNGWLDSNNPGAVASTSQLYLNVIGPTCRACHAQRGTITRNELDFASYKKFMTFARQTKILVYDEGVMPLAKRTYQNHFWGNGGSQANLLAQHISGAVNIQPGRILADAGLERIGDLSVRTGDVVTLNGLASLFPVSFEWRVTDSAGQIVVLTNATTATPSFVASVAGAYQVELNTSGVANVWQGSTFATTTINASNTAVGPATFAAAYNAVDFCSSCHTARDNNVPVYPMRTGVFEATLNYIAIRDRVDTFRPMDSENLKKALVNDVPHGGGKITIWFSPGSYYETQVYHPFLRWILDGAKP